MTRTTVLVARDLQVLFDYARWDNFIAVVEKAKIAYEQAGRECDAHFADVGKMISLRSGAEREIEDIALSRYAAYLTAHNADGRRRPIAFAQTYFAIQTRRQEIADQETRLSAAFRGWRRVLLRAEIKTHNRYLASAAKNAGVQEGLDFAIFQTKGYKGLYGGLDVAGIRRRKGSLRATPSSTTWVAPSSQRIFRATQTEDKLRRGGVKGKLTANRAHFEVGAKLRQTIKDLGGQMPEHLPAAEDIKKVGRRLQSAIKSASKRIK